MARKVYVSPDAQETVFSLEIALCFSGKSGTERVGVSSSGYTDSDFE